MSRLPFNPGHAKGGKETAELADKNPMSVSQVTQWIRDVMAREMGGKIRVVGQVSNFSGRAHWFFSLKDEHAALGCVCFASAARRVKFEVHDGMEVVATGRLDYYGEQGRIQLYVDKLEPVGAGALELQFRALCEELRGLGYFEIGRKKAIPGVCQKVAVVTSRAAAALQDVINTAGQRWGGCELFLVDVPVQGPKAAEAVAKAIRGLSEHGKEMGIDVIVLTRGGGSMEDLWAFNERVVADAVYECELPVVAAIGHETDTTVAELVADLRCATPTQAAMTVVAEKGALTEQLDQYGHRLRVLVGAMLESGRHRVGAAMRHPVFGRPEHLVDVQRDRVERMQVLLAGHLRDQLAQARHQLLDSEKMLAAIEPVGQMKLARQRTDEMGRRLQGAIGYCLQRLRRECEGHEKQLKAVSPTRVLERGFSMTLNGEGKLVRQMDDVGVGEVIETVVSDGRIHSEVVDGDGRKAQALPEGVRKPKNEGLSGKSRRKKTDTGPGLFG